MTDQPTTTESEAMEIARRICETSSLLTCDGAYECDEDQISLLIATALQARDARIAHLSADNDALFDALFDAIAMMGHAMNLSATAMIGGEVLKAQEVWQKGHDLLLGKRAILTKQEKDHD